MIDCISCGRCGKWATATGGGICEACVVRESRDTEITTLRAELARLQRNEDCVQRLIVWAAENGWNGVDNAKILDSFIIGLFDELRAELAAAKANASLVGTWEQAARKAAGEDGVQFIGPNTIFAVSDKLRAERDALAADNAGLRKALERSITALVFADTPESKAFHFGDLVTQLRSALAATPAQSLVAHDAALLRRLAARSEPGERADIAPWLLDMADRIEKEAQRG